MRTKKHIYSSPHLNNKELAIEIIKIICLDTLSKNKFNSYIYVKEILISKL